MHQALIVTANLRRATHTTLVQPTRIIYPGTYRRPSRGQDVEILLVRQRTCAVQGKNRTYGPMLLQPITVLIDTDGLHLPVRGPEGPLAYADM